MHLNLGLGVGRDVGVHAIEHTQSVRMPGHVGEQVADGDTALTMLLKPTVFNLAQPHPVALLDLTHPHPLSSWLIQCYFS